MAHILIIENSPLMRPALRDLLKLDGHVVETAVHTLEALTRLQSTSFDLLITDLMLPEMSGLKLVQKLRADVRHKAMPILIFTVNDDIRMRQQSLDAGANLFLGPPITVAEFKSGVQRLLTGQPAVPIPPSISLAELFMRQTTPLSAL